MLRSNISDWTTDSSGRPTSSPYNSARVAGMISPISLSSNGTAGFAPFATGEETQARLSRSSERGRQNLKRGGPSGVSVPARTQPPLKAAIKHLGAWRRVG